MDAEPKHVDGVGLSLDLDLIGSQLLALLRAKRRIIVSWDRADQSSACDAGNLSRTVQLEQPCAGTGAMARIVGAK